MKRPRPPKPRSAEQIARQFIVAHLGRGAFAPLTGTDWRAWRAFVYLVELWGHTREDHVIDAMGVCVWSAQRDHADVMQLFVQTIPAVLDWHDVAKIWPTIAPAEFENLEAINRDGAR